MDIRTAGVVLLVAVIFLTVLLAVQYAQNKQYRGLGLAVLAQATMLLTFGPALIAVPMWFAVVSVSATVMSLLLLYAALETFLGGVPPWRLLVGYAVVTIAVISYFVIANPDMQWRRFWTYILAVGMQVALVRMLSRYRRSAVPKATLFLQIVFTLGSIYFAGLALLTTLRPELPQPFWGPSLAAALAFLGAVVMMLLWTFGVVFMVAERLRHELDEDRAKLQQVFRASPDAVVVSQLLDAVIVDVNEGFTRMFGHTREEAVGRSSMQLGLWADLNDRARLVSEVERDGAVQDMGTQFVTRDGRVMDVEISARTLQLQGEPHLITVTRDVTQRVRMESELRRQALTDELTGVANRRAFLAVLAERVGDCCLVVLDLDGFKQVNDTLGHAAGDELVRSFARRAMSRVPDDGLVGRLGGDEFGVLLPGTDLEAAGAWVCGLLEALQGCTFSAGVATAGESVDELVAAADQALYRAKRGGRNQVRLANT